METPITFFKQHEIVPRQEQIYVLDQLVANWSKYKYFLLSCPTGVGKTYIATALASVVKRAYVFTSTLQLQQQYESSWDELVNIMGRGNYDCNLNPKFTVDAAPCAAERSLKADCIKHSVCAYYNQKKKALASHAMITNPLFALYSNHCGMLQEQDEDGETDWVTREALIIDEAHNIEGHLVQFAESMIDPKALHEEYGIAVQDIIFTDDTARNYMLIERLYQRLSDKAIELQEKMETEMPKSSGDHRAWARGFTDKVAEKVRKLQTKIYALDKTIQPIKIFYNTHETPDELMSRWLLVKDRDENKLKLSPVYADFLFDQYLGNLAEKFVFMSATPGSKAAFCRELGINPTECLLIEVDSPFNPALSPVIVEPRLSLSKDRYAGNIGKIGAIIDEILERHEGERGIIHSTTYQLQTDIYNRVNHASRKRLLCRDMDILSGKPVPKGAYPKRYKNAELLELHEQEGEARGSVLLSPSMMEGVDLKDDLSTFQILVRLPWPNLGDARVYHKNKLDESWYANRMWMHVLQASGRSTRHENDSSVTYILDASFNHFYSQWSRQLPAWFRHRVHIT